MTVASETNRSGPYNGNGATTVFSYGFRIIDEDHLRVVKTSAIGVETVLTIATDYTVAGVGNPAGGAVTLLSAPVSGETVTILRAVPFVQETDLENQGAYYAETVEDALDLAAMRDQQLSEEIDRSLRIPASASNVDPQLPAPEAGKIVAWNETATGLQNLDVTALASVISYGTANSDIFTGDGVATVFSLSANPGALNNLDVSVGGVTQLPGVDYTWMGGTNITFTSAPANGVKVLVRYMQALAQSSTVDDVVASDDGAGGAMWSTVKEFIAYLRSEDGVDLLKGAYITPEKFDAVGDGVTDDRAAIQAAVDYASANNMAVKGRAGAVYRCLPMPTGIYNFGIGPQPNIVIPAKAPPIDFQGATLKMDGGGRGFFHFVNFWPQDYAIGTVTADVAAGAYAFVLQTGEGALFQAGDRVLWQLGEIPYDKPETTNWGHAKVLSVAGDTVTLDRPLYEPFTVASVTTGRKRLIRLDRSWRKPVLRNVFIDGTVSSTVGAENGVNFYGAPSFECENVSGTFCGAGVIVSQYVEQAEISFSNAYKVNTTQASYGKHLSMAETRSVNMRGGVAQAMLTGIAAEADGEIMVDGYHFINTYPGNGTNPAANTVTVFATGGRAKIVATNTLITGQGGYNLANISNGQSGWEGIVQMRNVRIRTSGEAYSLPLTYMSGLLDYTVAGVRQVFNLDRPKVWRRRFRLKDNMIAAPFVGPPGLVIAARAYTSPGLTVGSGQKISRFYFGKSAGGAANGTDMATDGQSGVKLVPGQWVEFPILSGTIGGNTWTYRTNNQQIIITTNAAAGISATDDFVTIETLYVPEEGNKTYAYAEAYYRGEGDEYELYEALISAVDLPSIAAGATQTQALTIPDMVNTDLFVGYSISGGYGGLMLIKVECQTGQVMLTFKNDTAGAIDLSARDMRVLYAKPQTGA